MIRLCLLLFLLPRVAFSAVEEPTFIINGPEFHMTQANDYRVGNFEQPLSDAEIWTILDQGKYQRTDRFHIENKRYFYFVHVIDNRSGATQMMYLRYPLWFPETHLLLAVDRQLVPMQRYPRWGDYFFIEMPPGVHRVVGYRYSDAALDGKATAVAILDFTSLNRDFLLFDPFVAGTFAAVFTMILYNIGMYLVYRRIYFLYYASYSGAALFTVLMLSGYIVLHVPIVSVAVLIAALSMLQFFNSSLKLKYYAPKLYRASFLVGALSVINTSYSFFTADWGGYMANLPLGMGFCMITSLHSLRRGYKPATYFVCGWGLFSFTCCLATINVVFWGIQFFNLFVVFGFAFEIAFFSFAIGQKVRLSEQLALRTNQHAFNQLKKVFYPHQIEKIKEGVPIEETMPTGEEKACALCFDIVGSSRLQVTLGRSFIENSIKACVQILSEEYDAIALSAVGYRVKEIGDGFLCTVGYPFRTARGRDCVHDAMDLALRLVDIFQTEVGRFPDHPPIFCSIALATGAVRGHYPKVGVAEYDVDGQALDLAQRYEGFRKRYFPGGPSGHMITVHAALFEQLPSHLQKGFIKVDLREARIPMRDDPAVTHVYYRLFPMDPGEKPVLFQKSI